MLCPPRINPEAADEFDCGDWAEPVEWAEIAFIWPGPKPCETPDYLHDLNAMHAAEDAFGAGDLGNRYKHELQKATQCLRGDIWYAVHADAEQRAEAYLRALDLWEDEDDS